MEKSASIRLDKTSPPTTPDNTVYIERAPVRVPLNLSEWFPAKQLLEWITDAMESLPEAQHSGQSHIPAQRHTTLLTLLTLAYLTQMFRSRDIVNACSTDQTFINLCRCEAIYADELEHFRRKNRTVLQTLLGVVLCQAVTDKFSFEPDAFPAGFRRDLMIRAEERMDIARHMNTWDD